MAGLVKAGRRDEALQILESMKAGLFGDRASPGVTAYNALVMSHILSSEWNDALLVYEAMRNLNIAPDKTTLQGLLIACRQIGDISRTQSLLRLLLESNTTMDKQSFDLCLKILMPKQVRASSLEQVRARLRAFGTQNSKFKQASINLGRSLRMAEVEDERQESDRLSKQDLKDRREKAWRDVLERTLELSNLVWEGQ